MSTSPQMNANVPVTGSVPYYALVESTLNLVRHARKDPASFLQKKVSTLEDEKQRFRAYLHKELQKVKSSHQHCPLAAQRFNKMNKAQSMIKAIKSLLSCSTEEQHEAIEQEFHYKQFKKARKENPSCAFCGKLSSETGHKLRVCSKCDGAFYCNGACRKAHRKTHKKVCHQVVIMLPLFPSLIKEDLHFT